MTRNELANVRNRTIDRIVGMLESTDFQPERDKEQLRLFTTLCTAHKAIVDHIDQVDRCNKARSIEAKLQHVERLLHRDATARDIGNSDVVAARNEVSGLLMNGDLS